MAEIPKLGGTSRLARQAPVDPQNMSFVAAEGQAIQQLGKGLMDFGKGVGSLMAERERAEVTEFADTMSREFRDKARQAHISLNKQYEKHENDPDAGGYIGYGDSLKSVLTDLQQSLIKDSDASQAAKDAYLKKTGTTLTNYTVKGRVEESELQSNFYLRRRSEATYGLGQFAYTAGPFEGDMELKRHMVELKGQEGHQLTPKQVHADQMKAIKIARDGAIMGMAERGLNGLVDPTASQEEKEKAVDAFLDGKVKGTGTMMSTMTPAEHRRYRSMLLAKSKSESKEVEKKMTVAVNNAVDLMVSGEIPAPKQAQQIDEALQYVNALPDGVEKTRIQKEIAVAKEVGELTKEFPNMTQSELVSVMKADGYKTAELGSRDIEEKYDSMADRAAKRMIDNREYDFPQSVAHLDLSPAEVMEKAKELQVGNVMAISKGEQASILKAYGSLSTSHEKSLFIDRLVMAHPEDEDFARFAGAQRQVLADLEKTDSTTGGLMLMASYFDNNISKERVIDNSTPDRKSAITDSFNQKFRGQGPALEDAVAKAIEDHTAYMDISNLQERAEMVHEQTTLEAKRLMTTGVNRDAAIKRAANTLLNSNFQAVNTETANYGVPKSLKINKDDIINFSEKGLSNEVLAALGVSESIQIFAGTDQEFFDTIRDQNPVLVNNSTGDGVILTVEDPDDYYTRKPLPREDGTPAEIMFKDMNKVDIPTPSEQTPIGLLPTRGGLFAAEFYANFPEAEEEMKAFQEQVIKERRESFRRVNE